MWRLMSHSAAMATATALTDQPTHPALRPLHSAHTHFSLFTVSASRACSSPHCRHQRVAVSCAASVVTVVVFCCVCPAMPELLSLPVSATVDATSPRCTCPLSSSVPATDDLTDRSARSSALTRLSSAVSAEHASGCDPSHRRCSLLASHCRLQLLPILERRLCDDSEAIRSAAASLLGQSAPLCRQAGLCPLCLLVPLVARRASVESAEDIRCVLLDVLRCCCAHAADDDCPTAGPAARCPALTAVCGVLVASMADSCPAVRRSAAECAALLPSVRRAADQPLLAPLSSVLSSACLLLKQRLDVRKAAVTALAGLVPLVATLEHHSEPSVRFAPAETFLSLPGIVAGCDELLSSLCDDPKLSVRAEWLRCLSAWLSGFDWQRGAELWLAADLLLLLDDEDSQLREVSLASLTAVSSRSGRSVGAWLSARVSDMLSLLLRSVSDWKASERLRGCRQLRAIIVHADSDATSAHLDDVLAVVCRCLVDDDRAVRDKAREAITAGAGKWTAHCCMAAVQRIIATPQQQPKRNGQSNMLVDAAVLALNGLLGGSTAYDSPTIHSADDIDELLAVLESQLCSTAVLSPPSATSADSPLSSSAAASVQLLSLAQLAACAVTAASHSNVCHAADATQPCHNAACQPCRLFMALHALDCCMEEAKAATERDTVQLQRPRLDYTELHEQLAAVVRVLDTDGSLYVRCLPRLLSSLGLPAYQSEKQSAVDERVFAAAMPLSLLLWLRRSSEAVRCHWRLLLPLWAGVMADRSSPEADRARVVSSIAAFLSSPERIDRLTASQRETLMGTVLLPGCEWRPGAVNAVVRLHSLSCLHAAIASCPPSSVAVNAEDETIDSDAECAVAFTARLLAVLRSHVDDEQAACRATALSAIQHFATSTRGSHIRRTDGTTHCIERTR